MVKKKALGKKLKFLFKKRYKLDDWFLSRTEAFSKRNVLSITSFLSVLQKNSSPFVCGDFKLASEKNKSIIKRNIHHGGKIAHSKCSAIHQPHLSHQPSAIYIYTKNLKMSSESVQMVLFLNVNRSILQNKVIYSFSHNFGWFKQFVLKGKCF